jgi:hypothetical protein
VARESGSTRNLLLGRAVCVSVCVCVCVCHSFPSSFLLYTILASHFPFILHLLSSSSSAFNQTLSFSPISALPFPILLLSFLLSPQPSLLWVTRTMHQPCGWYSNYKVRTALHCTALLSMIFSTLFLPTDPGQYVHIMTITDLMHTLSSHTANKQDSSL